jgi:hypothetical protein
MMIMPAVPAGAGLVNKEAADDGVACPHTEYIQMLAVY